jgi:hypothetical protein
MRKLNYFKVFRKHGENLLSSSKFSYHVFSNFNKSRWQNFKKPFIETSFVNHISIGNFYLYSLINKSRFRVIQPSMGKSVTLLNSLVETKFVRSFNEASYCIRYGIVLVNSCKVTNKFFTLTPSDVVFFSKEYNKIWISNFFFTKFKSVTITITLSSQYEVSFSCSLFIFCF